MVDLFNLLLCGRTLTAKGIADEFGVGRAAGARRLELLASLDGAVEGTGRERSISLNRLVPRETTSANAVAAVCLASGLATAFEGTAMSDALVRLREDWVGRSRQGYPTEDLSRKFWFVVRGGESALPKAATRLGEIVEAILASQEVTFDYRHFNGSRERIAQVQPLTLALHEHQFYVIARRAGARPHPYRFARITNVRKGKRFVYPLPSSYDPRRSFQNVFGIFIGQQEQPVESVRLRFAAHWVSYIETHRWHETQEAVRTNLDGTVEVTLHVRVCHELRRWVLGFGADVEVLEPPRLRGEIAASLAAASDAYRVTAPPAAAAARPALKKARPPSSRRRARA